MTAIAKRVNMKPMIFFKSNKLKILLTGVAIGIASQRIPEFKAYTDKAIEHIEKRAFSHSKKLRLFKLVSDSLVDSCFIF